MPVHDSAEEHLAWCRQRALAYLNQGKIMHAVASMLNDLKQHAETAPLSFEKAGDAPFTGTPQQVRQWLEKIKIER